MSSKPASDRPSLFPDSTESAPANRASARHVDWITANEDGGARGNAGPAGYGAFIRGPEGKPIVQLGDDCGIKTDHVAEYLAVLAGVGHAIAHGRLA